MDGATRPKR